MKLHKYQKKKLLGRTYFTDNNSYRSFLVFSSMLNSIILDSNKKLSSGY